MSPSPGSPDASSSDYVVVARRYRPRGFDELVGQESVGRALKNAIETGRVGHAYLFTGARGVGKTSTARILAKSLNAPEGTTATPDPHSDIAEAIDAGEDVDVIEIDGASNRGIDEIRSLRANVGVRPSRSRYKVYIIDEVHMLTGAAFNALLKTLEEPPEHVKFIFCTTDPEKIPITVLSRCQRFDFAPVEVDKIVSRLEQIVTAEAAEADREALELIARRAAGSMRDSQSLLEQVLAFSTGRLTADAVHSMLGTADDERLHALARAMADRDAAEALRQMDAGIDAGVDAARLAEQLLGYFRDLMAATVGCEPSLMRHTSSSMHEELKQLGGQWGLQTVLAVVGLIDQTLVRIRHSVYSRVLLESTLIQICQLPDLQGIADLAAAADSVLGDGQTKAAATSRSEKKKLTPAPSPETPARAETPASRETPAGDPKSGAAAAGETGLPRGGSSEPAASSVPTPHIDRHAPAAGASQETSQGDAGSANSPPAAERRSGPIPSAPSASAPGGSAAPSDLPSPSRNGASAATTASPWNTAEVTRIWQQACEQMDPITATLARAVDQVEAAGPAALKLVFPAESRLAMNRCDRPEHRSEVVETLSRIAGCEVTIDFVSAAPKTASAHQPATKVSGRSRMQRMREIESNEMIQACVELFGAEIVRVDTPRSR